MPYRTVVEPCIPQDERRIMAKVTVIVAAGIDAICFSLLGLFPDEAVDRDRGVNHRLAAIFLLLSTVAGATICALLWVTRDCTDSRREWVDTEAKTQQPVVTADAVDDEDILQEALKMYHAGVPLDDGKEDQTAFIQDYVPHEGEQRLIVRTIHPHGGSGG